MRLHPLVPAQTVSEAQPDVTLRDVVEDDISDFFGQQPDPQANPRGREIDGAILRLGEHRSTRGS